MQHTFNYTYLPCQFCVGKNHCARCGAEIRLALLGLPGVLDVEMDVPARRLALAVADGADGDDIEDQAEALGVFL